MVEDGGMVLLHISEIVQGFFTGPISKGVFPLALLGWCRLYLVRYGSVGTCFHRLCYYLSVPANTTHNPSHPSG